MRWPLWRVLWNEREPRKCADWGMFWVAESTAAIAESRQEHEGLEGGERTTVAWNGLRSLESEEGYGPGFICASCTRQTEDRCTQPPQRKVQELLCPKFIDGLTCQGRRNGATVHRAPKHVIAPENLA